MADTPDRISELKAEFEKLLVQLQGVQPPLLRSSTELRVLQEMREIAKWVEHLR
jgi:hypothetical protein